MNKRDFYISGNERVTVAYTFLEGCSGSWVGDPPEGDEIEIESVIDRHGADILESLPEDDMLMLTTAILEVENER